MSSPRRALIRLLALGALTVAALVGCGGDDTDDATVVGDAPTTAASEEESTTTVEDEGDTTTTEGDDGETTTAPDEAPGGDEPGTEEPGGSGGSSDLADLLLTEDDLPAGFATEPDEVSREGVMGGEEAGLCPGGGAFPSSTEEIERQFGTEDQAVTGASVAARFEADADEVLQAFRDEALRCDGVDDTVVTAEEIDLGDGALAVTLGDGTFAIKFWLAAVDDVLVAVSALAADPDALDGEALLGTMVERAGG